MTPLLRLHDAIFAPLQAVAPTVLPTLARLVFAGVLPVYFWASALTKLGDGIGGIVMPSLGAYAQIFPRQMEAVSYDVSQLGWYHWAVVLAGTWAEFLLPALIVLGLLTRLAALGMIGFVVVLSLTDIIGHNADAATVGAWFDRFPDGIIADQRALWMVLLSVLLVLGPGPLSIDRLLSERWKTRLS